MTLLAESVSTARHRARLDAVSFLTVYTFLLFTIPSRLVFKPLGGTATPAALFGLVGLFWWCLTRLTRVGPRRPIGLVGKLGLIFLGVVATSFIAGMTRVINGLEVDGAINALLGIACWLGVLLVTSDSMASRERLTALLHRLTLFGSFMSIVGLLQFVTGQQLVDRISIPGLTWNADVTLEQRNGFARPAGTATHPLEFGLAVCMLLPIALHIAFDTTSRIPTWRRYFPVVALGLAIPLSLSRSAIISVAVILAFLVPTWTPRIRWIAGAMIIAGLIGTYLTVPGFLGTFRGLFTGLSDDSSILSRTDSYAMVFQYWARSPIVGRGLGTFNNTYRILDNQYLGLLIDTGLLGIFAILLLTIGGVVRSMTIRHRSADERTRSLAVALAASIAAATVANGFFDGFAFPIFGGLLFLCLGLVDANAAVAERTESRDV